MNDQMTGQLVYVSSGVPPYKQQPQKLGTDLDEQLSSEIRSNLVISEVVGRHVKLRRFGIRDGDLELLESMADIQIQ